MTTNAKPLVAALLAAITLSLGGAPAQSQTNVKFVLDWAYQGQQGAFTVPVDDGTFKRLGLNVTVDRGFGSGDTVTKVAGGAYEIGYADFGTMVRFNDANPGQKLIAVMMANDKLPGSVTTKNDGKIKTPKDLEGKRIASPQGDASRQLFPLFAKINNINESTISWINVSPELRETLLIRGEAEAITGDAPTILPNVRSMGLPESTVKVLPYADFGLELFGKAIIVRPDYAEKNPEVIRNLIRGLAHGFNGLITDPNAALASAKKRDPLLQDELEKGRIKMTLDYAIVSPNVRQNGYSHVDPARLDRVLKSLAEGLALKSVPNAGDVYTAKYLPPAAELKMAQ
jgi:NitT/TauT family transport system substrate-binding protein